MYYLINYEQYLTISFPRHASRWHYRMRSDNNDKSCAIQFSSEIETTLFDFLDVRSILLAESQDGVHDSVRLKSD